MRLGALWGKRLEMAETRNCNTWEVRKSGFGNPHPLSPYIPDFKAILMF